MTEYDDLDDLPWYADDDPDAFEGPGDSGIANDARIDPDPRDGLDRLLENGPLPLAMLQHVFLRAVRGEPLIGPPPDAATNGAPAPLQLQLQFLFENADERSNKIANEFALDPPPPEPVPSVSVDQAAAAALLASVFHRRQGLLRAFHQADATLLVRVPDGSPADPMRWALARLVLRCDKPMDEADLLARRPRTPRADQTAILLKRGADDHRRSQIASADDAFAAAVTRARGLALPTVVTVPADRTDLTGRIGPLIDHDLRLPDLTPAIVGAIVHLVTVADRGVWIGGRCTDDDDRRTGRRSGRPHARIMRPPRVRGLPPDVTLDDLRACVSARRGTRGSLARLRKLVRERTSREGVTDGPSLEELAGYGRAKELGLRIAGDLRGYAEGRVPWSQIDRGIVLHGAPGVGKTSFAKALAKSAGVRFFSGSYSEWQRHGHLGDFLAAMQKTFDTARRSAPCILLIDEIDSFQRRGKDNDAADYNQQCVNALLQQLDGANVRDGVFVMGATNHLAKVDPAIVRSGRLERTVHIPLPDVDGLAAILRSILDMTPTPELPDADLVPLSLIGAGGSGADASAWVRRARASARRAGRSMTEDDLREAIAEERPPLSLAARELVSVHEAGHVIAAVTTGVLRPTGAWIGPTGGLTETAAMGGVLTPSRLRSMLAFILAGREAERLLVGEVSHGAGGDPNSDLARATTMAVRAVASLGLGDGPPIWIANADGDAGHLAIPDHRWNEVEHLLTRAEEDAAMIVRANRTALERVADALRERTRIGREEIGELTHDLEPWTVIYREEDTTPPV